MNKHDDCVKEMYQSLTMAGVITMIIFSFTHTIFTSAGECLAFFLGTQMVLTYAVWTIIDILDRKKA